MIGFKEYWSTVRLVAADERIPDDLLGEEVNILLSLAGNADACLAVLLRDGANRNAYFHEPLRDGEAESIEEALLDYAVAAAQASALYLRKKASNA